MVANSALRHFSAVALHGRPELIRDTVRQWAVKTSWVLVPVAILWALFAPFIVELVYRRGAFGGGDVALASYLGAELGIRGVAMAHSAAVFVWMLAMLHPLRPRATRLRYSSPPGR